MKGQERQKQPLWGLGGFGGEAGHGKEKTLQRVFIVYSLTIASQSWRVSKSRVPAVRELSRASGSPYFLPIPFPPKLSTKAELLGRGSEAQAWGASPKDELENNKDSHVCPLLRTVSFPGWTVVQVSAKSTACRGGSPIKRIHLETKRCLLSLQPLRLSSGQENVLESCWEDPWRHSSGLSSELLEGELTVLGRANC